MRGFDGTNKQMFNIHRQNFGKRQRRDAFRSMRSFDGTNRAKHLTSTCKIFGKDKGEILLTAGAVRCHEVGRIVNLQRQLEKGKGNRTIRNPKCKKKP